MSNILVAPGSDAPEVVLDQHHYPAAAAHRGDLTNPQDGAGNQLLDESHDTAKEVASAENHDTTKVAIASEPPDTGKIIDAEKRPEEGKEAVTGPHLDGADAGTTGAETRPRKWGRRPAVWIAAAILVVAIIVGAVTGGVLGSRAASRTSSAKSESICHGTHCSRILAAVAYDQGFQVLARGSDNAIKANQYYGTGWGGWVSLGGQFEGQPGAIAWGADNRINVLAPLSPGRNFSSIRYSGGAWWPDWKILSQTIGSAATTCVMNINGTQRADIWVRAPANRNASVLHAMFYYAANAWSLENGGGWDVVPGGDLATATPPAVVCRDASTTPHDLVVYGRNGGTVRHIQWSNTTGTWSGWNDRGGAFVGSPMLVALTGNRVDFFGTGTDGAVYHFQWVSGVGYTALESLGGRFQSDPAAVVTGANRIDVVALSAENNRLQHRALIRGAWSPEWEDIGNDLTAVHSAPLLLRFGPEPAQVAVLVLGAGNTLRFALWNITQSESWAAGLSPFADVGGEFSTSWFDA